MTDQAENARKSKAWARLWIIAAIYLGWLGWLAYVAWVNINAGNQ